MRVALLSCVILLAVSVSRSDAAEYRMPITFAGYTNRTEVLTNFPVLVVLSNNIAGSGFNFGTMPFLSTNGWDLRFKTNLYDTGTSTLSYEIESWKTNSACYLWVRVPVIPPNGNGTIWATWGDTADSAQLPCTTNGAAWVNNYKAVWHLANAGDSSSNGYQGTVNGGASSTSTPAVIGNGWNFDGSDDNIIFSGLSWAPTRFSVSFWIKPDTLLNYNQQICNGWNAFVTQTDPSGGLYAGTDSATRFTPTQTGGNVYEVGKWSDMVFTYDAGFAALYKNGRLLCAKTGMTLPSAWTGGLFLNVGLDGVVDEVRVSSVARSSNWVWAAYQNTASNTVFNLYGSAQGTDQGTIFSY